MEKTYCPKCRVFAHYGKFCPSCGMKLEEAPARQNCKQCGNKVSQHDSFCGECGAEIEKPAEKGIPHFSWVRIENVKRGNGDGKN